MCDGDCILLETLLARYLNADIWWVWANRIIDQNCVLINVGSCVFLPTGGGRVFDPADLARYRVRDRRTPVET